MVDTVAVRALAQGPTTAEGSHQPFRAAYEIVVIAASAGGVGALAEILAALPADFPAPIAVLLHRMPSDITRLARRLTHRTALAIKRAEAGATLEAGSIYLAPPGQHLVIRPDRTFHLMDRRKVKYHRMSANPLFESAAYALNGRVIAVVLTGAGSTGVNGVQTVKGMGGTVIAQDPKTALYRGMPRRAIRTGAVDYVVPLREVAPTLTRLVTRNRLGN